MRRTQALALVATLLWGCRRPPQEFPKLPEAPKKAAGRAVIPRPDPPPDPLAERAAFAFEDLPLPEVISRLSRDHKLALTVSPAIPVGRWSRHRVTLRMKEVSRRAFLDWLVRPLEAQYAVEAGGGVWLSRSDDLLDDEPMHVQTYRVPTHMASSTPVRGALVFAREQAAIVETLDTCLRYMLERRPGCRIAFHGGQDLLVAHLPARGHMRLAALLHAMRHGSGLPELPKPSFLDLRTTLDTTFDWDTPPGSANRVLSCIADVANVNLGWDPAPLVTRLAAIPAGKYTLRQMLDAVVRQTPVGRYEIEPGHGIWLYQKGQDTNFAASGATLWDRAVVRAYEVRVILPHMSPEALLAHIRKLVDPGDWGRGLPAAAVFLPTGRLLVVHDEAGQNRIAAVVRELAGRYRSVPIPTKRGP